MGAAAAVVGVPLPVERLAPVEHAFLLCAYSLTSAECNHTSELNRSVIIGVDDEVGGNLLHVSSLCFAHR